MSIYPVRLCLHGAVIAVSTALSLTFLPSTVAEANENPATAPCNFTVVLMAPTVAPIPFRGSDGRTHLLYEVILTPTVNDTLNITDFQVLDGDKPERVLLDLKGNDLESALSPDLTHGHGTALEGGRFGTAWVDMSFDKDAALPSHLLHSISYDGPSPRSRVDHLRNTGAVLAVNNRAPLVIGSPVQGGKWLAAAAYNSPLGHHRRTLMSLDNKLQAAERYAIDWIMLDEKLRSLTGSNTVMANFTSYGQPIIAVADGNVVGVVDKFGDQPAGKASGDFNYPGGNTITQDLGNGNFALYAHLKPGSIKVHEGDKIKRGQVLADLGNSGNSDAPHLHFHMMDGPASLGSNGVPYVFDSFTIAGQAADETAFLKEEEELKSHKLTPVQPGGVHKNELPEDMLVVTFPQPAGK